MNRTFEQSLVEHCAPTLAGLKPASLFCFCKADLAAVRQMADSWDRTLKPFGIRILLLKERPENNSCIVYAYRPAYLEHFLKSEPTCAFLARIGYSGSGVNVLLDQLSRRLELDGNFPHEIGVFLGYPLEDVVGFIENQGRNFTCSGCWKSYGDPIAAQRRFARYRACTSVYKKMYGSGIPIIQLIAAA